MEEQRVRAAVTQIARNLKVFKLRRRVEWLFQLPLQSIAGSSMRDATAAKTRPIRGSPRDQHVPDPLFIDEDKRIAEGDETRAPAIVVVMRALRFEDRIGGVFFPRVQIAACRQRDALHLAVLLGRAGGVVHVKQCLRRMPNHVHRPDHVVVAFAARARGQRMLHGFEAQPIVGGGVRHRVVIRQREVEKMDLPLVGDDADVAQFVGVRARRCVHAGHMDEFRVRAEMVDGLWFRAGDP